MDPKGYALNMLILNSMVPLFLLMAFGAVLRKTGFFPPAFFKGLNRLVFWFALPALLISRIGAARIDGGAVTQIVLLFTAGTVLSLLLAWVVARAMRLPTQKYGSFIQGSFRGNGAFVGLPVIAYTLGAETLGTVVLAPVVILFNILGVSVLLHYSRTKTRLMESAGEFVFQLVKNPLLVACAIGLVLNLAGGTLPLFLLRPLDALGDAALPLILMSIGASLELDRLRGSAAPTVVASLIKVVAAPAIGFLIAGFFDLTTADRMIAIFYLACPAAGMSYVMAEVMGNDAPLAGRIVVLSTLLSAITLPIIIALSL